MLSFQVSLRVINNTITRIMFKKVILKYAHKGTHLLHIAV